MDSSGWENRKNTRIGQNHHKHQSRRQARDHDRTKHNNTRTKFTKLFTENQLVKKNIEKDIQLKDWAKLIQEKDRPIPYRLQEKAIETLKKQWQIEKAKKQR